MPTPIWEWTYGQTVRKQLDEMRARPDPTTGAYGQIYRYDANKPTCTATLSAKGMTRADADTQRGYVMAYMVAQTYTMADGTSVSGIPFSYSDRLIEGSNLYEVTVEIVRTDL